VVKDQGYIVPKKSIFNKVVGDSHFELEFAGFLENCDDIISYAKNYFAVHFKIDYKNADGNISEYYPDFIVKVSPKEYYIVETKGREDLDDIEKIKRLEQWCVDVNSSQKNAKYQMIYIKQEDWEAQGQKPRNFQAVIRAGANKRITILCLNQRVRPSDLILCFVGRENGGDDLRGGWLEPFARRVE
jgi:type III restriction enzyme